MTGRLPKGPSGIEEDARWAERLGWRTIRSRVAWQGRFPVVEDEIAANLDGRRHQYTYLATRSRAVAIVAQDSAGQILTVREYRHPLHRVVCDLPMGSVHRDEEPAAAAMRELREETGYRPGRVEWFGCVHPIPALTGLRLEYFIARQLEFVGADNDQSEIIETAWIPLPTVLSGIAAGQFDAGALQLGVLLAQSRGLLVPSATEPSGKADL